MSEASRKYLVSRKIHPDISMHEGIKNRNIRLQRLLDEHAEHYHKTQLEKELLKYHKFMCGKTTGELVDIYLKQLLNKE